MVIRGIFKCRMLTHNIFTRSISKRRLLTWSIFKRRSQHNFQFLSSRSLIPNHGSFLPSWLLYLCRVFFFSENFPVSSVFPWPFFMFKHCFVHTFSFCLILTSIIYHYQLIAFNCIYFKFQSAFSFVLDKMIISYRFFIQLEIFFL